MKAVVAKNISKSYLVNKLPVTALQNISFEVEEGELFGLVGPDGAGKTTLFRLLTTLLIPDQGSLEVLGYDTVKDLKEIRDISGYMPGRFSLYQDLTVKENLDFFATIFNTSIKENYELVKDIYSQIEPFNDRRAGKLSGGMKQKLALSCALIHKPKILFLDEPTTGVDAVSRKEFWEMLRRLKAQGITILVSTPYMDEASLCDRVALIQEGKILALDKPDAINSRFGKNLWAIKAAKMVPLLNSLKEWSLVYSCFSFGEFYHVVFKGDAETKESIEKYLFSKGFVNVQVDSIQPNIEDTFMALMNNKNDN
jgi:ABC-type multidrug transport system ATPase subunit